jgi:hypothetical protein
MCNQSAVNKATASTEEAQNRTHARRRERTEARTEEGAVSKAHGDAYKAAHQFVDGGANEAADSGDDEEKKEGPPEKKKKRKARTVQGPSVPGSWKCEFCEKWFAKSTKHANCNVMKQRTDQAHCLQPRAPFHRLHPHLHRLHPSRYLTTTAQCARKVQEHFTRCA